MMKQASKTKPGLGHIARLCGVSKMTVSRALRNDPHVSEATRRLVLDVAERENYLPGGHSGPAVDPTPSIRQYYVLFDKGSSLQDAFFSDIIRAIQHQLFLRGRSCSFGVVDDEYSEFIRLYDLLQTANVAGILIVGDVARETINTLLGRFGNVVLVDNPGSLDYASPCSAVFCENSYGSLIATRHLLGVGRRRVLLIRGAETHYFSQSMLDGYRKAHAERGLEVDDSLVLQADFHAAGGYDAAKEALSSGMVFDAVFSNDEMACGAIRALYEAGIRIPEDVSVVGFDDLPLAQAVTPQLTSVAVDREAMATKAVELLLKMEKAKVQSPERIGLYPRLIVRGSCGGRR